MTQKTSRFPLCLLTCVLLSACDNATISGPKKTAVPGDTLQSIDASPELGKPAPDADDTDVSAIDAPTCTCGDGTCNAACQENGQSCPSDCAACGDGICSPGEGPKACPEDCCGACGDGLCKGYACGETPETCSTDCGKACGNKVCDKGETPTTCPEDCSAKTCGNGVCEPEDGGPAVCPEDCKSGCGNCICDKGEDWTSCPLDCGYCGDAICSPCAQNSENAATCPADCKSAECLPNAPGACDDGNVCTTDSCTQNGICLHVLNAAPCDDNNACSVGDACKKGACAPGELEQDCDDGNPCTGDTCDAVAGCKQKALVGVTCDDGNSCTTGDKCVQGKCAGGAAPSCNDFETCTDDACDPVSGCVHAPNIAPCSDGNACTEMDACVAGACKPGDALDCDDDSECTNDSCAANKGCVHLPAAATCEDGDACTDGDYCFKGLCKSGMALECEDGNPCTLDKCDHKLGCITVNSSEACSDGDACTMGDACAGGKCKAGEALDCDDGEACTTDSCAAKKGCVHVMITGTCQDGDACTADDFCFQGVCKSGTELDCDDANVCTSDKCDHKLGCIHTSTTGSCDDGDACTKGDTCASGKCQAGATLDCNDGKSCTADSCSAALGCQHAFEQKACSDGDACTVGDDCVAGSCISGKAAVCDDGDPCTDDACDSSVGCKHKGNIAPCDDGNACTLSDACFGGSCVGGKTLSCDDSNPCTGDSCTIATGTCVHLAVAAACDDGDLCTALGACQDGACMQGQPKVCNDGNPCTDDACTPATGTCSATANKATCDDGNACTMGETCINSVCTAKGTNNCSDADPCSTDACDAQTGLCSHTPKTGCLFAACSTDLDCGTQFCDVPTHTCRECLSGADCSAPGTICQAGHCTPGTKCQSSVACKAKGQVCNVSGGYCATCITSANCPSDALCIGETCVPKIGCTNDLDCSAVCALDLGACVECNTSADCVGGGACGPDHACRAPTCQGLACAGDLLFACKADGSGYATKTCGDGNPCTDDACDGQKGCVYLPNAVTCDDGQTCTVGDQCSGGSCVGGTLLDCNDDNICTDDACDKASSGCVHLANTVTCTDGNPCTSNDPCGGGVCKAGAPTNCSDGNVCTDDTCTKTQGCQHAANAVACEAQTCTWGDVCAASTCVSSGKTRLFDAVYTPDNNLNFWGYDIGAFSDGSIALAGSDNASNTDVYVTRWGLQGQLVWNAATNSNYEAMYTAVVAADQTLVMAGVHSTNGITYAYMLRVNSGGGFIDSATFQNTGYAVLSDVQIDPGGGYIACGTTGDDAAKREFLLLRADAALTKVFAAATGGAGDEHCYGVAAHPKGGYVMVGSTTTASAGLTDGMVVRTDPTGAVLSSFNYGGIAADAFYSVQALEKGGFAISGATGSIGAGYQDGWLMVVDDTGKKIWEQTYGGFLNDIVMDLAVLDDGFALVGYSTTKGGGSNDGWLVRTDPLGNFLWDRSYGGAKDDILRGIRRTPDGGLALGGYTNSYSTNYRFWALRTDAWGYTSCGATGFCAGVAASGCDDGNPCTADVCAPLQGCSNVALADGSACGVGGAACASGQCVGGL